MGHYFLDIQYKALFAVDPNFLLYLEFSKKEKDNALYPPTYWVTQKLPQICTVILRIYIGKVA